MAGGISNASFAFKPFSTKQKKVLTWWMPASPVREMDGIIADGSVRSGKTLSMSLSFVEWAMHSFMNQNLGMAGKTISSFRRNVWKDLKRMLSLCGMTYKEYRNENMIRISLGEVSNDFYIFGGKDEGSQDLIQGITLAGMFFDEVALMPESFVNQATARCSVDGSKWWFNCNPDSPAHFFNAEWIKKYKEKQLLYLHFTMDDNLSLTEKVKARYRAQYSGVFYKRYILGLWVMAEGVIYDMFDPAVHMVAPAAIPKIRPATYYVSCDYGTQNATVFHLWGQGDDGVWYALREYYYSGRDNQTQKTDTEYADDLEKFLDGIRPQRIVIDPSAASFIAELKKRGYAIKKANNDVLDGIRYFSSLLLGNRVKFSTDCSVTEKEFASYAWDAKASERGEDKPVKTFDHAMDSCRYFGYTIIRKPAGGLSVMK